jgi:glycerol uptake facilitator-like aquaporin
MFAYLAGWGRHAFPPGVSFLTVYILAPTIGAIAGGGVYLRLVQPHISVSPPAGREGFA